MSSRSAAVYADFLLPHLTSDTHLVDIGCGSGELARELAAEVAQLTGVDNDPAEIENARTATQVSSTQNANFMVGDAYALPLPDDGADAVFAHSVLETLERPAEALAEIRRVLRPAGIVAVASVEYSGLILAGPYQPEIRRFYNIREQLWLSEGADPYRGRTLRGLLLANGFARVDATSTYVCYGTSDTVRQFGTGRANDCIDDWYVESAERERLATRSDLAALRQAWLAWSESPDAYAAFAWCRALGWKH